MSENHNTTQITQEGSRKTLDEIITINNNMVEEERSCGKIISGRGALDEIRTQILKDPISYREKKENVYSICCVKMNMT